MESTTEVELYPSIRNGQTQQITRKDVAELHSTKSQFRRSPHSRRPGAGRMFHEWAPGQPLGRGCLNTVPGPVAPHSGGGSFSVVLGHWEALPSLGLHQSQTLCHLRDSLDDVLHPQFQESTLKTSLPNHKTESTYT